jgi:hypothetical protein
MSDHGRLEQDGTNDDAAPAPARPPPVQLVCSVVVHSSRSHDERVFSTGAAGQRLEVLLQGVDRAHKVQCVSTALPLLTPIVRG